MNLVIYSMQEHARLQGGGGCQVEKGAAPALHILRKKGSFLGPPHVCDL